KNYYNNGTGSPLSYVGARAWDGTVAGKVVEDGVYHYEYKAKVDYEDAEWQSKSLPVYIDTVAPTATFDLNEKDNTLTFNLADEGVGVSYYIPYVNGKKLKETGTFDAGNNKLNL